MEEQYIVSARKYRPQTFKSVVGQSSLTATLKNAITQKKLAHAYLFCGPRGVGKTTCARIFAKSINCFNPTADGEACNNCESCISFNEQRSFNIHELDAASNNSVDNIRELVDHQSRIPPQVGKYSLFIIDEVHMLSTAAFNAFLKTLEEPPAHAIFVLATTEKHKIIPTILSRCQIYDFNRIKVSDTVEHLKYVAKSEGIEVEEMALNIIAQKADGAMRDALSIFDQVVSFCGNNVTYKGVIENLNVLDYDYYFRLVDALLASDVKQSLLILDEVLNKGFEAQYFVGAFASHLRNLLVSKDSETIKLMEVGDAIAQQYEKQAQLPSVEWLYQAIQLANECDMDYRLSRNKRLLVEVMLIRVSGLNNGAAQLKKAKPELQLIAVAPTLVSSNNINATAPVVSPTAQSNNVRVEVQQQNNIAKKQSIASRPAIFSFNNKPTTRETDVQPHASEIESNTSIENTVVGSKKISDEKLLDCVVDVWCNYARSIEEEAHTTNAMLNFPPEAVENNTVLVKLVNSMQYEAISVHKRKIESLFAQASGYVLNLNIIVDATTAQNEVFTDEEKLKRLVEKNAAFAEFRLSLGLELI